MPSSIVLETKHLCLRSWQEEDLEALHQILSDPHTMAYWPSAFRCENTAGWLERAMTPPKRTSLPGRLAVHLKETNDLIGDAGRMTAQVNGRSEVDLGYIIHHP